MTVPTPSFTYADAMLTPMIAIAGDGEESEARARATLDAAGAACRVPPASEAPRPPAWVELDASPGAVLEDLLVRLDRAANEEGVAVVVAAPRAALDAVAALVSSPAVEVLIEPDAGERALAAAMLAAFARRPAGRAAEAGRDLRTLSEEVARIAETLAQLSQPRGPAVRDRQLSLAPGASPRTDPARVRAAIRERRLRADHFDRALFADPAWDMLLDLYSAALDGTRVPVSSLCAAAEVPPTTALRWIRGMTERGLFERKPDPTDARRVFMALSAPARAAMARYFAAVDQG